MTILVTGGAGFIGCNFVRQWLAEEAGRVVTLDALTYAGRLENLSDLIDPPRHWFVEGDVADGALVAGVLQQHRPSAIVHFAAETHVDRSLHRPDVFVTTNVLGTFRLLEATLAYWRSLPDEQQEAFRFLQVSTDEVYGALGAGDPPFTETSACAPNSPYAASKASADHLVRAFGESFGLPVLTSRCGNNFGPFQFPEKLIPLVVTRAVRGEALPIYGRGDQVRDWLYVEDHCRALRLLLERGKPGACYNVGAGNERSNLELVRSLCALLDVQHPGSPVTPHRELIQFVADRPGHDFRYALDGQRLRAEVQWEPRHSFEEALERTVAWYLDRDDWLKAVMRKDHGRWLRENYGERLAAGERGVP